MMACTEWASVWLWRCAGRLGGSYRVAADVGRECVLRYWQGVLEMVKKQYVQRHYGLPNWVDHFDFLERLARKFGKLHKGNEADIETTARMVLNDLIRGKLLFFQEPPPPPPPGTVYTKQDLRAHEDKIKQAKKDAANAPIGKNPRCLAASPACV